jgi:predicted nucleic acid-binding protein
MKDSCFIDTNIFVYAAMQTAIENPKREVALDLILNEPNIIISTQVINEFYSVLLKHKIPDKDIVIYIKEIIRGTKVYSQHLSTLKLAWIVKSKYEFSLWDSLIIASALQQQCNILYTEDLQHLQIIEKQLTIINPFK